MDNSDGCENENDILQPSPRSHIYGDVATMLGGAQGGAPAHSGMQSNVFNIQPHTMYDTVPDTSHFDHRVHYEQFTQIEQNNNRYDAPMRSPKVSAHYESPLAVAESPQRYDAATTPFGDDMPTYSAPPNSGICKCHVVLA